MTEPDGLLSVATASLDESNLIAQAKAGDLQAFEILIRKHADRVYTFLVRWLGDASAAEDVLQDTTIRAYDKLDTFIDAAPFKPWLFRIAINQAKTYMRSRARAKLRDASWQETRGTAAPRASGRLNAITVLECGLASLNARDRQLLWLRFGEEMSLSEVSDVVGTPVVVLKMRLHRARERFRRAVSEASMEVET